MLGNSHYFHGILRKYVITFGQLFNDLEIVRRNENGNVVNRIEVPLEYAPRSKVESRFNADPELNKPVAISLPRMSFEMQFPVYDPTRKHPKTKKIIKQNENEKDLAFQYVGTPFDIPFTLNIYVEFAEDGTQIIEQILPFFAPEFTPSINLVSEIGHTLNIPIILTSGSFEDSYEGDFESRRAIIYTLEFMMKGWLFGPVQRAGVIRKSIIDYGITSNNTVLERTTITPGLTAAGNPTDDEKLSIAIEKINANDNYGYIVNFEEFFKGELKNN